MQHAAQAPRAVSGLRAMPTFDSVIILRATAFMIHVPSRSDKRGVHYELGASLAGFPGGAATESRARSATLPAITAPGLGAPRCAVAGPSPGARSRGTACACCAAASDLRPATSPRQPGWTTISWCGPDRQTAATGYPCQPCVVSCNLWRACVRCCRADTAFVNCLGSLPCLLVACDGDTTLFALWLVYLDTMCLTACLNACCRVALKLS